MKRYWNNLRPFEKRVVVVVLAMVFIVFNVWFVMPHFSDWSKVKIRMGVSSDKLKKYQSEVAQIPTLSNQVWTLEKAGLSVPPEEQSVQFLRAIQMQAAESVVNIVSSGPQVERTNQFFLELTKTFNLQSEEGPLVDFLFKLGDGNSLLRVRDMTLRPDAPHQKLNTGIKLVASYQKKAPARPVAAATPAAPPVKPPQQTLPGGTKTNPATKAPQPSTTIRQNVATNKAPSVPKTAPTNSNKRP